MKRLELTPAIDVSTAHDLVPHLKRVLAQSRTPVSVGAVLYVPFPKSQAGTTYEVHKIVDGPGHVDEATEIVLHYHDAHLPEGAFDVTFEDVGGLGRQIKLIRELVQLPLKFPARLPPSRHQSAARHHPLRPARRRQTHVARAVANEVEARFYYINGPDVIGTYYGRDRSQSAPHVQRGRASCALDHLHRRAGRDRARSAARPAHIRTSAR